jgi:hypothetical protein
VAHLHAMVRRRHCTMPVKYSDSQQVCLEEYQQIRSENAPKLVNQLT